MFKTRIIQQSLFWKTSPKIRSNINYTTRPIFNNVHLNDTQTARHGTQEARDGTQKARDGTQKARDGTQKARDGTQMARPGPQ